MLCAPEPGIFFKKTLILYLEINEFLIEFDSQFIVIASDGVWEYLSNKDVVDIVKPFYLNNDIKGATTKLIDSAVELWSKVVL